MMRYVTLVCSFMLVGSDMLANELPAPYQDVNLMSYRPDGWYGNHEAISALVRRFGVKTIVEVGSWMGASTLDMAQMVPPDGKIYAVDTWNGSPNETHDSQILNSLYDQFLSNMIHAQVADKVIPIRMESLQAAAIFTESPDLIYIDATHTYEACYADLTAWYPHVKGHGIICGDDLRWGDCGVERAVRQFARENRLRVYDNGWFWWLE